MHDPRDKLGSQNTFDMDFAALIRIESDFLQVVQRMTTGIAGKNRIAADNDIIYRITA